MKRISELVSLTVESQRTIDIVVFGGISKITAHSLAMIIVGDPERSNGSVMLDGSAHDSSNIVWVTSLRTALDHAAEPMRYTAGVPAGDTFVAVISGITRVPAESIGGNISILLSRSSKTVSGEHIVFSRKRNDAHLDEKALIDKMPQKWLAVLY